MRNCKDLYVPDNRLVDPQPRWRRLHRRTSGGRHLKNAQERSRDEIFHNSGL
jgi:hypothetical protein